MNVLWCAETAAGHRATLRVPGSGSKTMWFATPAAQPSWSQASAVPSAPTTAARRKPYVELPAPPCGEVPALLQVIWSPRLESVTTSWCVVPSPGMSPVTYSALAPRPVRDAAQALGDHLGRVGDRLAHHALDDRRAVAPSISSICSRIARRPARALLTFSRMLSGSRLARTNVSTMSQRGVPCSTMLDRRHRDALVEEVAGVDGPAAGVDAADVADVQRVEDPAEELAVPEHRRVEGRVGLLGGADVRVVLQEDVAVADARRRAAVLQRPLHDQVGERGEELDRRADDDDVALLRADRRRVVARVDDGRRPGDALDDVAVLQVLVPEARAQHLIGDRIDVEVRLAVQLQRRIDAQRRDGDVRAAPAVPRVRLDRAPRRLRVADDAVGGQHGVRLQILHRSPRSDV